MGVGGGVAVGHAVGDDEEVGRGQRLADAPGVGHGDGRVGAEDPEDADLLGRQGLVEGDRFQAGGRGQVGRAPEIAQQSQVGGAAELQVGGEEVGEGTDLAAAHGVGLAGDAERASAGFCRCGRLGGGR